VCSNKNNKGSAPTTTTSSTTQSGARVRVRDEKERVLEGEKLSLLEQLESVREELVRVKEEGDRKEGELRKLVALNEEQLRVEVEGCARKLEAMSVQLRSCEQEVREWHTHTLQLLSILLFEKKGAGVSVLVWSEFDWMEMMWKAQELCLWVWSKIFICFQRERVCDELCVGKERLAILESKLG
jgi:predicted RNase H-like nuclease (RuvC/YqgF family)